jgi:hypothetical protein
MELVSTIKNTMMMRIEDPFWNSNFSENLPKWIHIWITSIGLGTGIIFILNTIFQLVDKENSMLRLFAFMGLVSLVLMLFNRDTFLPFLSENFMPEIFLQLKDRKPKKADKKVHVRVEPNSKVLYWAADPGKEVSKTWKDGYGKFENSGIVTSDVNGKATIPLECPNRYIVHGYKILPKHVHYRVYNKNTQMLSRIYTVVLSNECK